MKRMLDLFSGLHGASAAFRAHPEWEVVAIDNNPDLDADHHWDISMSKKQILELGWFDLIWASPPCIEFFKCRAAFYPDHFGKQPDMSLVNGVRDIIALMDPTHWVIENTKAGAHFISPIMGPQRVLLGPFYLWGNFPRFEAEVSPDHKHEEVKSVWSSDPLRSNKRAKVPIEISAGLLDVIEAQTALQLEFA